MCVLERGRVLVQFRGETIITYKTISQVARGMAYIQGVASFPQLVLFCMYTILAFIYCVCFTVCIGTVSI